ncbi:T9SS type B sorting domain-containing protein [Spirosoma gilvum]
MKRRILLTFFLLLKTAFNSVHAQNIAGYWLGVTTPSVPSQEIYNYAMMLTQTNFAISGTAQTSDPNVPFSGIVYVTGTLANPIFSFSESDKNGSIDVKDVCFWRVKLTYSPVEESMLGTYEHIVNGTTCTKAGGGKMDLFRIVLKSGTKYCKGKPVNLLVTGQNIRWYSSAAKTTLLATGNRFSPNITRTTTFYITQTLYQNESPPVPITVEVVDPTIKAVSTNSGCDKANGSISVTASGSTGWQYNINDGPFQDTPLFAGLRPGSYKIVAKDTAGCQAAQTVTITTDAGPSITSVKSTPPHCETANGEVNVVASGGKTPLTYSIDYGITYQSSPTFTKLAGGAYTLRVRDANGCETNSAVNLPNANPIVIQSTAVSPTSCGQANGQVSLSTSGGKSPVQYSIDNQTFQTNIIFTGLQAGTYTLLAKDSEGCTASQSVSIAASTGPSISDVETTPENCGQANATLLIKENNGPSLFYSLNGSPYKPATSYSGLKAGAYTLSAKDATNCIATRTVDIRLDCVNLIHLPTAFSPNRDTYNDELKVYFAFPSLTIARFTVYDRWGTVIYNRANFVLASGDSIWDGQQNGQPIPVGMYTYRLDCLFPDGTQTTYRESVSLLN